jgi:fumarate reductase (CoM/CoB) subunit B
MEPINSETKTCLYCPNLCLHACPVSNAEKKTTVSPWNKMSILHWVFEGEMDLDAESASLFYKCTGCLACQDACVHEVDVPRAMMGGRALAVKSGVDVHPPALFDRDSDEISKAISTLGLPNMNRAAAVYMPGCDAILHRPEEVVLTVKLLDALGCGPVTVGPRQCCGYPLWAGGHREAFRHQSTEHALELRSALRLIVGPGSCAVAIGEGVGSISRSIEPLIEVVSSRMDSPEYRFIKVPGKTALFNGCLHNRRFGLGDRAARILDRICEEEVQSLRWSGAEAHCCGAGGCYSETSPKGAAAAARIILEMGADAGVERLVSFDPDCVAHLRSASDGNGVEVVSGVELLSQSMGIE